MEFTTLDIILLVMTVAMIVVLIVYKINNKKFVMKAIRRMDKRYAALLNEAECDKSRLAALYHDAKGKSAAKKSPEGSTAIAAAQVIDIEKLAAEQKELAAQKMELSDRNRQLWDMSVSIEKERQHIQNLKNEIERQHQAVTSSIQYAKLIQDAVLPSEKDLKESFEDVFLFWRPRNIVSGDFYWMKRIGDTVLFTVADCTGHGVPGAFMSMLGVAFLNDVCVNFNQETTPAHILEEMRRKVIDTLKQDDGNTIQKDGIDMAMCMLNLTTMKMQFSGANRGMYHVRGSVLTEYRPVRNPVGIYPVIRNFENHDVDVQHGDYIYMFSDGYSDQFSSESQKFTAGRLRQLIIDINTQTKQAARQAEMLADALDNWRSGFKQMDDILIGGYCIR
jgi:serine phosphatase RsbU (regulator of sigma subunit)